MVVRYNPRSKYQHWHDGIIVRAKLRNLSEPGERHHIFPKCFGGSNKKENLVKLTYREHFLIHWLLTKTVPWPGKRKMLYALSMMVSAHSKHSRICSSWQYALAAKAKVESAAGQVRTPEAKAKQSKTMRHFYAENPVPVEECEARSLRMLGNDYGKYGSGTTGYKHSLEECEARRERMWGNQFARGKKFPPRSAAHAEILRLACSTPSHKRRKRAACRQAWADPEVKAKASIAQRRRRARERAERMV